MLQFGNYAYRFDDSDTSNQPQPYLLDDEHWHHLYFIHGCLFHWWWNDSVSLNHTDRHPNALHKDADVAYTFRYCCCCSFFISTGRKRNQFIDCWTGGSREKRLSLVWVVYFVWLLSICWFIACTVFVYVYSKSFVCVSVHSIDTLWMTTRLSYKIIKR